MSCGCCSCGECLLFLSGSPGKSRSSSVDNFPDTILESDKESYSEIRGGGGGEMQSIVLSFAEPRIF